MSQSGGAGVGVAPGRDVHPGVLQELTDTDIPPDSKRILKRLLSKDLVLGNYTEAEQNEIKWHLRIVRELFLAIHPDQNCRVVGEDRAAINDDPTDTIRPLSEEERLELETFFMNVQQRLTRGRDMKQQEMMNTRIAESRSEHGDSGGGGLLGRLKS